MIHSFSDANLFGTLTDYYTGNFLEFHHFFLEATFGSLLGDSHHPQNARHNHFPFLSFNNYIL
jgi:hypothetical protein